MLCSGHWENLGRRQDEVVLLVSERCIGEDSYVLANPTAAGLVKSPHEWSGVISHRFGDIGIAKCRTCFFDEDGVLPTAQFSNLCDLQSFRSKRCRARSNARDEGGCAGQEGARGVATSGARFAGRDAVLRHFDAIPKTGCFQKKTPIANRGQVDPERIAQSSAC